MTVVKPFRAVRPVKDKVHLVASRSVDTYSPPELRSKLAENPYTFLHIIKPYFGKEAKIPAGSRTYLEKIKETFTKFREEKIFIQEDKPAFYIYRQIKPDISFTGIIGCASIDDYFKGVIKIHEQTLSKKEEVLKEYLDVCDFNAEPVNLTYPADEELDALVDHFIKNQDPLYDFTTTDRNRHQVWIVSDPQNVSLIEGRFKQIRSVYIADGHHRSASSALLGKEKREQIKKYTGSEGFNYFLAVYYSDHQLKIYDYNRLVKDLNGLSVNDFIEKIKERFDVEEKDKLYKPQKLHSFSMYLDGKWYSLTAKKNIINDKNPVGTLDATILSENILSPILNIADLRTDKRISFINGTKGMEGIGNEVDKEKARVGFGLYPVSIGQLKNIADTGNIMPPKTTWIEPKLRSGLLVYSLRDEIK